MTRDAILDGYRGVAVLCVVAGHALAYRFADVLPHVSASELTASRSISGAVFFVSERFAGPLAKFGVRIFFVISGYIITTLLLSEEQKVGRINISAFYVRRCFRILPPLIVLFLAAAMLRSWGVISFGNEDLIASALFTCNTGLAECGWWFAHTWSLAVEEQFYLVWPLLLAILPRSARTSVLGLVLVVLMLINWSIPFRWHSNALSFSCITVGALYASSAAVRDGISRVANFAIWLLVVSVIVVHPVMGLNSIVRFFDSLTPLMVAFVVFSSREVSLLHRVLVSRPLQIIGLGSYSLYLWQQIFLGRRSLYFDQPPELVLFPLAVVASVFLIERPFQRIGRSLSALLYRERSVALP